MKKRKNTLANCVMVAIIACIVVGGVLGVGYIRGWFGDSEANNAVLTDVRGIVNLTRNGVTYPVEQDTPLRAGDTVTCTPGGTAVIRVEEGSALTIGEQAAVTVTDPDRSGFAVDVTGGELFAAVTGSHAGAVTLTFDGKSVVVKDAVVSLSYRTGAQDVNVYYGAVNGAASGEALQWVGEKLEIISLPLSSLNAFAIARLRGANETVACCFANAELDSLEADRAAQKDAASLATMSEELAALDLAYECTVTVRCDTILNNYDKLDPAKAEFVPDDGIILATVKVPFTEGESALDATRRACDAYGIQLEYSWTPLYNSSYVEGINQLYEFDCGPESGWTFKVNGWTPNYGCSAYILQDEDAIQWLYTCVGLGADIEDAAS